jgi:hypothetical protein
MAGTGREIGGGAIGLRHVLAAGAAAGVGGCERLGFLGPPQIELATGIAAAGIGRRAGQPDVNW